MSYVEMGNVMFRGQLRGATGQAKFKLTASAVNAVDTIHIAGNQVTYSNFFTYASVACSVGSWLLNATINVPDSGAYVEVIAYGHGAASVRVDGVTRPNRNKRGPSQKSLPFVELIYLAPGNHTVTLISGFAGTSASGFIMCRYIRRTGYENT